MPLLQSSVEDYREDFGEELNYHPPSRPPPDFRLVGFGITTFLLGIRLLTGVSVDTQRRATWEQWHWTCRKKPRLKKILNSYFGILAAMKRKQWIEWVCRPWLRSAGLEGGGGGGGGGELVSIISSRLLPLLLTLLLLLLLLPPLLQVKTWAAVCCSWTILRTHLLSLLVLQFSDLTHITVWCRFLILPLLAGDSKNGESNAASYRRRQTAEWQTGRQSEGRP